MFLPSICVVGLRRLKRGFMLLGKRGIEAVEFEALILMIWRLP